MNGRTLVILVVLALLVGGGFASYVLLRDRTPASPETAAAPRPSRDTTASRPAADAPAATPEPTTAAPRRPRRAESAPAAPAPVPEPAAAAPELGTLRIEADVPNAQVFIDRKFIGTAPVTADAVTPGTHQLNVSAEGFEGIAQTIDVEPGPRDVTIRFREVRLSASIAVIHKHRMGSCKGELVATAQGLRYNTDDKDDRFTAALGDLETFVVDYQDKNLKIKLRKGKQFNFTDPDGNADRLFVFQRDVDKARQRLIKGDVPASN